MSENVPEYSVAEISGAIKRTVEDAFGYVRVRGELGRVSRSGNGHCYLDLKDDRAVLSSVIWKGTAGRLGVKPEQGMEVIATGRLSTFPGQSRYQLVIDQLEPAGAGALMALLEKRKKALAAEGLFDPERKRPLPYLPSVIGVVTSPSGAVIRDILHRLRDRFPTHVLVWPTPVQGEGAGDRIAAAVEGFGRLSGEGVPRPDVLIVARGGGSLEDLWCFNDERVVRAVAASDIPVLSAVGHETDTTLIDFAADRRAPTPTAAAEMAVPVRLDLLRDVGTKASRLSQAVLRCEENGRLALTSASRGLGRPDQLLSSAEQRFDRAAECLSQGLRARLDAAEARSARAFGALSAAQLRRASRDGEERLSRAATRLGPGMKRLMRRHTEYIIQRRLPEASLLDRNGQYRREVAALGGRLARAGTLLLIRAEGKVAERTRLLGSLSYRGVLERGFAVVRQADGTILRRAEGLPAGLPVELLFADGTAPAIIGQRIFEKPAPSSVDPAAITPPKERNSPSRRSSRDRAQATLFGDDS